MIAFSLRKVFWLLFLGFFLSGCSRGGVVEKSPRVMLHPSAPVQEDIYFASWLELPADIILIIDQSGSMSRGKAPTDPGNLRIKSSLAFVEFIARRSNQENPDRLGIVNFGTDAPRDHAIPLTPIASIDDPNVGVIQNRLKPLDLGDTSFIKAFRLAVQLFREGNSFQYQRNRAIVVFTDGEPDDPRKLGLEQYFAELSAFLEEEIKPNDITVFVIGIDAVGKAWSATVPHWRRLLGEDYVVTVADLASLPERFSEIVQRIYKLPPQKPILLRPGVREEFDVPPYLASLEFFVFSGQPDATVRIFRPDGKVVQPGVDPDTLPVQHLRTCDLIVMQEPEPGIYQYEAVGAEVRIVRNFIPFQMRLINPLPIHPQGKTMQFLVEFRRADGKAVKPHPDYPLGLFATVIKPSGERILLKFFPREGQEGVYLGEPKVPAGVSGEYGVVLKVVGGDKYQNEFPVTVKVQPVPYLSVEEPQEGIVVKPSSEVKVRVRILKAGHPLAPEGETSGHPDYLVLAQIIQAPGGERGPAVWLSYRKEEGIFEGSVPVPGGKERVREGQYVLAVRLAPGGEAKGFAGDQAAVAFTMQEPPAPLWMRWLKHWAPVVVPVMVVGVGIFLYLYSLYRRRLRVCLYYWADNSSAAQSVVFERPGESKDLISSDIPVRAVREGKSKSIRLMPMKGAKILTQDKREMLEVRIDQSTTLSIVVESEGGERRVLNVGLNRDELTSPSPSGGEEEGFPPEEGLGEGGTKKEEFDWEKYL